MNAAADIDGELLLPGMERTAAEAAECARLLADEQRRQEAAGGALAARFVIPPFSVLDARAGAWQDRKRMWLALGIQSEIGRGENLLGMSDTILEPDPARRAAADAQAAANAAKGYAGNPHLDAGAQRALGAYFSKGGALARGPLTYSSDNDDFGSQEIAARGGGTSIFDPVLCELSYKWFSPPDGAILDPFAGGSVRGIVAGKLGRSYHGVDLSARQIAANEAQRAALLAPTERARVNWTCGDSRELAGADQYDMVFSCPPYSFLERYSDDPRDLSTLQYAEFLPAYAAIIKAAAGLLRNDRFAVFVVSHVRERKNGGAYHDLPGDTVAAFAAAGCRLYNWAILVTAVGSLSIRTGPQMVKSRKLGRAHQDVLVFVKGDPFAAAKACGDLGVLAESPELVSVLDDSPPADDCAPSAEELALAAAEADPPLPPPAAPPCAPAIEDEEDPF